MARSTPFPAPIHRAVLRRTPTAGRERIALPPGLGAGVAVLVVVFGWGPNPALFALSLAVLVVGGALSWRPGEPAIILYAFAFQWLEASLALLSANLAGVDIAAVAQLPSPDMAGATALTLAGLLVLAAAFRLAAGPPRPDIAAAARAQAMQLRPATLAAAWLAATAAAAALTAVARLSPGLSQPLLALASMKSVVVLIIAYAAFVRGGTFLRLFLGVFAAEFVIAIGGFFSSFKLVFVLTFVAMLAARVRLGPARMLGAGVLVGAAVLCGVLWTSIKVEYRAYVNRGTLQQVVAVGWAERMGALAGMVARVDGEDLARGADQLVRRISYVDFFGEAMTTVPRSVPHAGGALWAEAIAHPFTPRLLFPDKPALDASAQTREYTGLMVAGTAEGTQISIGYLGESYIDFGAPLMLLPIALFGWFSGLVHRRVVTLPRFRGLIGMFMTVPLFMIGASVGQGLSKLVGAFILTTLVILALHAVLAAPVRRLVFGARRPR